MKLRRRDIIKQRQQETYHQLRKAFLKKVNIGLVAFASGNISTHLTQDTPIIKAMEEPGSQGFSKSQFLDLVAHSAQLIAGENDLYASVMIAQAALESGWGNSGLASAPNYNLFGIKGSYNNQTVVVDTLEDDGSGHYYQITDGFRKYNNYAQSLQDYANLLTGNHDETNWRYNYYYGARKSQTNSYQEATAHLTGRYATDTSYAQKLNRIIHENDLTRYDVSSQKVVATVHEIVKPTSHTSSSTHEVQTGDTYWAIAQRYNVSVSELQSLNNHAAIIYPGQQLVLPQIQETTPVEKIEEVVISSNESSPVVQKGHYTVKPGDTMWRIARVYGMDLEELKQLNNTTSSMLQVGQKLQVNKQWPKQNQSIQEATIQPVEEVTTTNGNLIEPSFIELEVEDTPTIIEEPAVESPNSHVVQAGDTLYSIAQRNGLDVYQLIEDNGSTTILPGQVIEW